MIRFDNFFKSKLWQELWLYFFIGVKLTNWRMKLPEPKVKCLKEQMSHLFCEPLLKLRYFCLADNYFARKPGFEVN